jgi:hypothetical protein
MRFIYILCVLSVAACGYDGGGQCYNGYFENITNYTVKPDAVTPSGIRVDTGGYAVDFIKLDARLAQMEACIQEVARASLALPRETLQKWQCLKFDDTPLNRACLVIKVVSPAYSSCSDWQHIPVEAPADLCEAKGLTPTADCHCLWRTAIQDNNTIITPPAMYLWDVGRMMTTCNDVWRSDFAKCLSF